MDVVNKKLGDITLKELVINCDCVKDCESCPLYNFTRGTWCFIYGIKENYHNSPGMTNDHLFNTEVNIFKKRLKGTRKKHGM